MVDVFSYSDYRALIKDFYENRKKSVKSFTFAKFAEKAGFSTRSFLMEVISGKKNLAKGSIYKVAQAMELNRKELEYFDALVNFTHAGTSSEREHHFERIKTLQGKRPGRTIGIEQYDYFSKWYHMVIRELVVMEDFNGDFNRLARKLRPPITARQARESVDLLLRLNLLEKRPGNRYAITEKALYTGNEIMSNAVVQYQHESIKLADQALDKIPGRLRNISTFTTGLSAECFQAMKKEIQAFSLRLEKMAAEDKGQDRVYQLNMQFFPVSSVPEKE